MQTGTDSQEPKPGQLALLALSEADRAALEKHQPNLPAPAKTTGPRRYKRGLEPTQAMLLPPKIEDYVATDSPVRAISAYVDSVDLSRLAFKNAGGGLKAGQPAYDPTDLLKLYLYGYLNRVRSSRRLEAECLRNLEVIWLIAGLRPGYHTLADFRKNNASALTAICKDFVQLCQELGLFGGKLIGIDGSFFNGDASHASVKTKKQLQAEVTALERDIERYQQELDAGDANEANQPSDGATTEETLAALQARADKKTSQIEQLESRGETQLSRTDPDARRLAKNGKKVTGYNVQTVIDDEHKLVLTHEVTNAGNDFGQLAPMIDQAQQVLAEGTEQAQPQEQEDAQKTPLEVLADAGYYTEADIAECEKKSVVIYVPIPDKHRAVSAKGRIPGTEFHYDADENVYLCPGNQKLQPEGRLTAKRGKLRQRYRSKKEQCKSCPLSARCLPEKGPTRQIYRSEHAEAVDRHRQHMSDSSGKMRQRAAICEHPFGTMKRWLGWDHFLVRGFEKVRGEMALLVTCYNLRRLLTLFGVNGFVAICEERRRKRQAQEQQAINGLSALLHVLIRVPQALRRRFLVVALFFSAPKRSTAERCSANVVAL